MTAFFLIGKNRGLAVIRGEHMKPLSDYDDFLRVEDTINILVKNTNVGNYDFVFRQHFECKSIIDKQDEPVLLRIGAIQDFDDVKNELESVGCSLMYSNFHLLKKCKKILHSRSF